MTLIDRIRLSRRYGTAEYIVSGLPTVVMSVLVALKPLALPECFIIKLVTIPIILYLFWTLSNGKNIYFYLNLGISKREYFLLPLIVEFVAFLVLMTITGSIGYAFM